MDTAPPEPVQQSSVLRRLFCLQTGQNDLLLLRSKVVDPTPVQRTLLQISIGAAGEDLPINFCKLRPIIAAEVQGIVFPVVRPLAGEALLQRGARLQSADLELDKIPAAEGPALRLIFKDMKQLTITSPLF